MEALIQTYRSQGLNEAADILAAEKERLQARGLLPPQLEPVIVRSASGSVSIRRDCRLLLANTYEIDELAFTTQTRNALVSAGVGSLDELSYLLRQGFVSQVRNIGKLRSHEIEDQMRRRNI